MYLRRVIAVSSNGKCRCFCAFISAQSLISLGCHWPVKLWRLAEQDLHLSDLV